MLSNAARDGQLDELYNLLAQNPYLLQEMARIPITETPVHISARFGKTEFAMEISTLEPSLALKLNEDWLSPMHLALKEGHSDTAKGLATVDCELIRVKGKERITPLHVVAEIGDVEILEEFLKSCPSAIEDLTVRQETAVHIAVKNKKMQALKFLFGWLHRQNMEYVLSWKDKDGNTALHIAVLEEQPQALKLLVNNVDMQAKNDNKMTAMEIFKSKSNSQNVEIGEILLSSSFFSSLLNTLISKRDQLLGVRVQTITFADDIRSVVLVVAVLIATATYQAVLSPPGGYWQDTTTGEQPHQAGTLIMSDVMSSYFALLNSSAFCASVCTIVVLVMGLSFAFFLEAATLFISCSYFVALFTVFPSLDKTTVCLLVLIGVILVCVHLVAFEAHRRKREMSKIGKYQWKYHSPSSSS